MKQDIYENVTNQIIKQLEDGIFPWVQPWGTAGLQLGLPANTSSKNNYSGVNILLLWGSAMDNGFLTNNWLTFKQAKDLGGKNFIRIYPAMLCQKFYTSYIKIFN